MCQPGIGDRSAREVQIPQFAKRLQVYEVAVGWFVLAVGEIQGPNSIANTASLRAECFQLCHGLPMRLKAAIMDAIATSGATDYHD
jgi:hypothetical protein